jgi:hypothetical protein
MRTHGYKQKTAEQFLDFIKWIDQKYDNNIKQIFLVQDNISIHKVKQSKRNYGHVPSKNTSCISSSNLIARSKLDRGKITMDAYRQAINNSTFGNEQDIDKAVVSD